MDEITRMVAFRSAAPLKAPSISITTNTELQARVMERIAERDPDLRGSVAMLVKRFPEAVVDRWEGDLWRLDELVAAFKATRLAPSALLGFVRSEFQNLLPLFSDPAAWARARDRVCDTVLVAYVMLRRSPVPLAAAVRALRALELIRLIAFNGANLSGEDVAAQVEDPVVALPLIAPATGEVPMNGIMDVFSLRHHVIAYRAHEIKAIENVMAGETRTLETKETMTSESERTEESESQTETSEETSVVDRFAFKQEIESKSKEQFGVKAGLDVGYGGGGFHISASTSMDFQRSKETAVKNASEVAKEVTRKSASKLTERVSSSQRNRLTFTRKRGETHVSTSPGPEHAVGVYRWVDAEHECGLFFEPGRMIVDAMVPEPAAFLRWIERTQRQAAPSQAPPPFVKADASGAMVPVMPVDLAMLPSGNDGATEYYGKWAATYGVQGLMGPEQLTLSLSSAHVAAADGDSGFIVKGTLEIPSGYEATSAVVTGTFRNPNADPSPFFVAVGGIPQILVFADSSDKKTQTFASDRLSFFPRVRGTIAFEAHSEANKVDGSVVVHVECAMTPEARVAWQDKTFAAILAQLRKLEAEEREREAALAYAPAGMGRFAASTPGRCRQIEREELKRSLSAILLRRRLTDFELGAVSPESDGAASVPSNYPEPDVAKAQSDGAVARFIEQAFEWEQMGYVFYPYCWGRRTTWPASAAETHEDAAFQAFLRAGAARVVVPVRREFEWRVHYVLNTGNLPDSTLLPSIGDPAYLALSAELEAAFAQPMDAPVRDELGNPVRWRVTVPTDLAIVESGLPMDLKVWE